MFEYEKVLKELEEEYQRQEFVYKMGRLKDTGIRSSQVRALVGFLIKKGVLEADEAVKINVETSSEF